MKKKIYKAFAFCIALGMTAASFNFTLSAGPAANLEKSIGENEKTITISGIKYVITVTPTSKFNGRAVVADNRNCKLSNVVIPDKISYGGADYDITEISDKAFFENNEIKTVYISKNVSKIDSDCFASCNSLTQIEVDKENKYYRSENGILYSFNRDTLLCCPIGKKLETFNVPSTVRAIGECAFYGNDKLYSVNFPTELREIGEYAFANCSSLSAISVLNKLEKLGDYAFAYSNLSAVGLSSSLKEFGKGAFLGTALKTVRIPSSIEEIPYAAFYNCEKLKSVVIGENVVVIGDFAFSETGLTEVVLPPKTLNINYAAFYNCPKLANVRLNNAKVLGDSVFQGCTALTKITITKNVQSIGENVFVNCDSLQSISVEAGNRAYTDIGGILYDKDLTQLIKYPNCNFNSFYELPSNIRKILPGALDGCRFISEYTVEAGNMWFSADDGVLYDFDKNTIIVYPMAKNAVNFSIPDRVRKISPRAFNNCLISGCINIPPNVTEIGENAFAGCKKVNQYNVHKENKKFISKDGVLFTVDGKTLIQYPVAALPVSYAVPSGVATIDASAFRYSKLTEIALPDTVTVIGANAFRDTAMTEIKLPSKLKEIGTSAFDTTNLLKISIPASVTNIGDYAFAYSPRLYEVTFRNASGLKSAGSDIFMATDNLKNIYVPAGSYPVYKNLLIEMDADNYIPILSEKK